MSKRLPPASLAVGLAFSLACGSSKGPSLDDFLPEIPEPTGEAQSVFAGTIDSEAELIDGPAAQGRIGDYFIRNSRGRFVVREATRVFGVIPPGGNLIDAVPVGGGGDLAEDQFGELSFMYLLGRTCEHESVEVVRDGSEGGVAAIVARGIATPNEWLNMRGIGLLPVRPEINPDIEDGVECATTYLLEPDSPRLKVYWTLFNPGGDDIRGPLAIYANTGGDIDSSFSPRRGFERAGIEAISQGANPAPVDYAVYQAPGVAYGVIPRYEDPAASSTALLIQGISVVVLGTDTFLDILQPAGQRLHLEAGGGFTQEIDFAVGLDAAGVEEVFRVGQGEEVASLSGLVEWSDGEPAGGARVGVFLDLDGDGQIGADEPALTYIDAASDGRFEGRVPPGAYLLRADILDLGRSEPVSVSLTAGGIEVPPITMPAPVRYDFTILDDETDEPMPGLLSVIGRHPYPPDQRVHRMYDVVFGIVQSARAIRGTTVDIGDGADSQLVLPAGAPYRIYASRGTEWSIESQLLEPEAGDPPGDLTFRLRRVAAAEGYLSSEYHVHQIGSADSPVGWGDRLATAVAAGIEVFAATDHDRVTDLQPVVEAYGLERLLRVLPGLETTPFAYGHFNGWPIEPDPDDPAGGPVDWARGIDGFAMIPAEIYSALRESGAEVVQINHPRPAPGEVGFMHYFDRAGLTFDYEARTVTGDQLAQPVPNNFLRLPPEAELWDSSFDALEVWNGFGMNDTDGDGRREIQRLDLVMRDWFNFVSFGLAVTPIGSSDTHSISRSPIGMPRTYVRVGDDSPEALASGAMVEDLLDTLAGRGGAPRDVIVTNGPHILVTANGDSAPLGEVVDSAGGPLDLVITARAPLWAEFDTIEIFANATPDLGASVTALQPLVCFTTREPAELGASSPCGLAPLGGPLPLTVDEVPAGGGFTRWEATVNLAIEAGDVVTRDGAMGSDAWFVVRVRGDKAIVPILLTEGGLTGGNLDALVEGEEAAVDAALQGRGVPATAFTAPIFVDFDGGGYQAPFAPQ